MRTLPAAGALELGPDVVRRLLPHRPPLLLVDRIHRYEPGGAMAAVGASPPAVLCASRYISANEPVFAGHFPQLALWPGVYTLEGLGQACNLLFVLIGLQRAFVAAGRDAESVLGFLRNAERGYTLSPGFDPTVAGSLEAMLPDARVRMGMAAHVDVKFVAPVFAGCKLDYRVELLAEPAPFIRCGVEATVNGQVVARGTMTSTRAVPPLPLTPG